MAKLTRTFTVEELEAIGVPSDLPADVEVADEHVEGDRWTELRRLLFRHDGRVWEVHYRRGLTEYQDCDPFDDDTVIATAVEEREVTITRWMPVEADDAEEAS